MKGNQGENKRVRIKLVGMKEFLVNGRTAEKRKNISSDKDVVVYIYSSKCELLAIVFLSIFRIAGVIITIFHDSV